MKDFTQPVLDYDVPLVELMTLVELEAAAMM